MPQEPKKKHSKARKRTRRASIHLESLSMLACKNCGQMRLPHQACRNCGFYNGTQAVSKTKITKA
jgi:large subunit ribosomal protein L32